MSVVRFPGSKDPIKNPVEDATLMALVRSSLNLHEASDETRRAFRGPHKSELMQLLRQAHEATRLATERYLELTYPEHRADQRGTDTIHVTDLGIPA